MTTDSPSVIQAALASAALPMSSEPRAGLAVASTLGQELLPPGVLPHGDNCGEDTS